MCRFQETTETYTQYRKIISTGYKFKGLACISFFLLYVSKVNGDFRQIETP